MPLPPIQSTGSQLKFSYGTTRYIDFDNGNDANSGLTAAQAWKTFSKAIATEWTPIASSSTTFNQLWIIAGTKRGTDQAVMDAYAARVGLGAISNLGIRAWTTADGTRPTGAAITRPLLRADTAFGTLTLVSGTIYKSDVLPAANTTIGQVLYKALQTSQFDADGCSKSHIYITGQGTTVEATIATNLTTAGNYTAYYKTDTRVIYVNVAGSASSTTASDWSWTPDGTNESWANVQIQGFNYVSTQGFTTAFGERGIAIFDARNGYESYDVDNYEHKTHGHICSYSNDALTNIWIENASIWGLGQSSIGNTMLGISGQSGNNNVSNVTVVGARIRRYMLQTPGGTNYYNAATNYGIAYLGLGTAIGAANGVVLPRGYVIRDSEFIDLSASKVSPIAGWISNSWRHQLPSDDTAASNYPVVFERCYFRILSGLYEGTLSGSANEMSHAYAFDNCRVEMTPSCSSMNAQYGYRMGFLFDLPAGIGSGAKSVYGLFNGTEWVVDLGNGDGANRCAAIGVKTDSANGNPCKIVVSRSKITVKHSSTATISLYDQSNAGTAGGVDMGLAVAHYNSMICCATPPGHPGTTNLVCFQDAPATGNAGRVFVGCEYNGFTQSNFSSSNASFANWTSNVDTTGVISTEWPYQDAPHIANKQNRSGGMFF